MNEAVITVYLAILAGTVGFVAHAVYRIQRHIQEERVILSVHNLEMVSLSISCVIIGTLDAILLRDMGEGNQILLWMLIGIGAFLAGTVMSEKVPNKKEKN